MKSTVSVDLDVRRGLFQKIVESLRLVTATEDWDLSWGDPFIAVTKNSQIWVRIFYEESYRPSVEKLRNEIDRLKPLIPQGGQLSLCFPQSWQMEDKDLPDLKLFPARYWSYNCLGSNGAVLAHEVVRGHKMETADCDYPTVAGLMALPQSGSEQRLSSDEVRELADIGLELKRVCLKGEL